MADDAPMTSIGEALARHHDLCDESFAQADADAARGDLASARRHLARFREQIERHFGAEESLLFPALERATGNGGGPAAVMRAEHAQMRELTDQMVAALGAGDVGAYQDGATTLLILIGQHNHKEESILYPMCDATIPLAGQVLDRIIRQLQFP